MPTGPDVRPHLPALRRYALALARDPERAEDLVQEALLRALAGARTWRPGRAPLPWLLAILHNAHVSRGRRRALEEAAAGEAPWLGPAAVAAPQPERVHLGQTVAALMRLPEEQRAALVLTAVEGLSYRDAAEVLGVPVGTLMSRLGRGREALRAATGREAPVRPALRLVR